LIWCRSSQIATRASTNGQGGYIASRTS